MIENLEKWTALIVAVTGLMGMLIGAVRSDKKQGADYDTVKILAEQLAEAREGCN